MRLPIKPWLIAFIFLVAALLLASMIIKAHGQPADQEIVPLTYQGKAGFWFSTSAASKFSVALDGKDKACDLKMESSDTICELKLRAAQEKCKVEVEVANQKLSLTVDGMKRLEQRCDCMSMWQQWLVGIGAFGLGFGACSLKSEVSR